MYHKCPPKKPIRLEHDPKQKFANSAIITLFDVISYYEVNMKRTERKYNWSIPIFKIFKGYVRIGHIFISIKLVLNSVVAIFYELSSIN